MKRKQFLIKAGALVVTFALGAGSVFAMQEYVRQVQAELRPDVKVAVDGQQQTFTDVNGNPVYPLLYNGSTYLPVRAIGNLMGKTVTWDERTNTVGLDSKETANITDADVIIRQDGSTETPGAAATQAPASTPAPTAQSLDYASLKQTLAQLDTDIAAFETQAAAVQNVNEAYTALSSYRQLDDRIDRLDDQIERASKTGVITWEQARELDAEEEQLDSRIDRIEEQLERRFGIDD